MPRTLNISNLTPDTTATFDSLTVNNNLTVSGTSTLTGAVAAAASVRIGASPGTTALGISNTDIMSSRNAADSGNIRLLQVDASNNILIDPGGATVATAVVVNEAGEDTDFRIESDTNANHFVSDAGAFGGAGAFGFGSAALAGYYFHIGMPALTGPAAANFGRFLVDNTNAITVGTGTSPVIASVQINEPNITLGGNAVSDAYSVYISGAPTEGTRNGALWIASGTFRTDGNIAMTTVGQGLSLKQGTNAVFGTVTLSSGGTALVYSTAFTANTVLFLTNNGKAGTLGTIARGTLSGGAIQISSTNAADTSSIGWLSIEPS